MPTQGQPGSGGGKALAIGAGLLIGGLLLFGGSKSAGAATTTPSVDAQCKDLAAKAEPLLLKATAADVPALNALLASVSALGGCGDLGARISKKIADLGAVVPPVVTPTFTTYKVVAGDTPLSIAKKFGISVEKLMTGLNGYGHGGTGKDNAPYPYGSELHTIHSTFTGLGTDPYPPAGTTFTPTFQAGHVATANLHAIFRSSSPNSTGQNYWWFGAGTDPGSVPFLYSPNDPGFGLIYNDGAGLKLVGPWYRGLELKVPAVVGVAGEESAVKDPLCTSCGSEMTASVEGCVACGTKPSAKIAEALREEAIVERTANGFGGGGFGGGAAGIMGEKASVGGFFPARPFGGLRIVEPMPIIVQKPAYVAGDYDSGYKLGQEDVRRARTGALVYMSSFVATAGADYFAGYKAGVTASGGVLLGSLPGKIQVSLSADSGGGFGGGRAAGYGYVGSEASPAQTRALKSLEALRSKVSGELSGLIDAATTVIQQGKPINMLQIPVVPGSEPIIECLRSFDTEIRIAGEEGKKAAIEAYTEEEPASVFGSQFGRNQFGQGRR